jgi:hypothetical protein
MQEKIVSLWIMAKSIYFPYKRLIFKNIESKKNYNIQNQSQQKFHACVPLRVQLSSGKDQRSSVGSALACEKAASG